VQLPHHQPHRVQRSGGCRGNFDTNTISFRFLPSLCHQRRRARHAALNSGQLSLPSPLQSALRNLLLKSDPASLMPRRAMAARSSPGEMCLSLFVSSILKIAPQFGRFSAGIARAPLPPSTSVESSAGSTLELPGVSGAGTASSPRCVTLGAEPRRPWLLLGMSAVVAFSAPAEQATKKDNTRQSTNDREAMAQG